MDTSCFIVWGGGSFHVDAVDTTPTNGKDCEDSRTRGSYRLYCAKETIRKKRSHASVVLFPCHLHHSNALFIGFGDMLGLPLTRSAPADTSAGAVRGQSDVQKMHRDPAPQSFSICATKRKRFAASGAAAATRIASSASRPGRPNRKQNLPDVFRGIDTLRS